MKRFYQIWFFALILKTALAIWVPFSNDESYYWVWGHHPQLSYFDHPPMVGWLFSIGTLFENLGNGARLPGVWLGHLTLLIWSKILSPYLSIKQMCYWLTFILLSPFFGLGSLVITPDVPLVFFWSLAILLLIRTLQFPTISNYFFLGATLGLGFCSKYMIVLFVPIALLWIIVAKKQSLINWRFLPLTIFAGLLFCFPVLYWNYQHDWASIQFQLNHGLKSEKWNPLWPGEYLLGQIFILFPTVVWLTLRKPKHSETLILHFFGWLPIAFFFYSSFKAHVEANWPIMAHPALLSLAFINAPDSKALRRTAYLWATVSLLAISEVIHHWFPIERDKLKTAEFSKFDIMLPLVQSDRKLMFGSYQMASAISYKTRQQFYKVGGMNRRDFYDFVPQSFPDYGRISIAAEVEMPVPEWVWKKGFVRGQVKQLSPEFHTIEVERAKDPSR